MNEQLRTDGSTTLIKRDENEDALFFAEEEAESGISDGDTSSKAKWKVIVVDDEEEVHHVTKLVLGDFEFDGKRLHFLNAHSSEQAMNVIAANPDAALMLLDVVMEKEDAGLQVVKFVRDELRNQAVRIILRTGQPGQAPEKTVIMNYDINDYKEKTELTSQKLFTTVISALRSYRDIRVIEGNKAGLEEIIKSSATLFELQSMKKFASGVLIQLTSILNLHQDALHCNSYAVTKDHEDYFVLAATGEYGVHGGERVRDVVSAQVFKDIEEAFRRKESLYFDNHFAIYFRSKSGSENVIYMKGQKTLNEWDRYLIEIYGANVSVAFENIRLNEELENTQKEIIFTMGEIAETRSKETGYHVKRVAEYSHLLALRYGLPEDEAEMLRLASPMHDVGKVGIPDAILNKPGKLTSEEFDIMKSHCMIGYGMLNHSNREIIQTASTIAMQHHEKFNGQGYPLGLKGEQIHIHGRITAVADVFDALATERVYKKAWAIEDIVDLFRRERGEHFDPLLVDLFLDNMDEFVRIKETYSDGKVF